MPLITRVILWGAGTLVSVAIISVLLFWYYAPDMCGNDVISESNSPDGTKRVVVFQRDCGATTGFSTQASVLPINLPLPNKGGNLFSSDTDDGAAPSGSGGGPALNVKWESAHSVVLTYHPKVRVFNAVPEAEGIHVRYITTP